MQDWYSNVFGCQVELVVLVAQRLEGGQRAQWVRFQRSSPWRTVDRKARRAGVNPRLDGGWCCVNLVITGAYQSSKEDRVVLYVVRRQPSDFGGFVMSSEDFRSLREEPLSMEWSRQKESSGKSYSLTKFDIVAN